MLHFLNHLIDAGREIIQIFKSFDGEVLGWRPVILHALKVAYDIFGAILLLIYYALEVIVLLVYLLHDFLLESDLTSDPFLHPRALRLMLLACLEYVIKFRYGLLGRHLQCLYFVALVCQGAVQAKDHVARGAVSLVLTFMLTVEHV